MTRTLILLSAAASLALAACAERPSTPAPAAPPPAPANPAPTPPRDDPPAAPVTPPREEPTKITAPKIENPPVSAPPVNPTPGTPAAAPGEIPLGTQTLDGTLRGDIAAIGGETTGWMLVIENRTAGVRGQTLELDVSAVQAAADTLRDTHVRVTGEVIDRNYVERGRTRQMRVTRIEAVK